MSYILDALKKAEAERKFGALPDNYVAPVAAPLPAARGSAWRSPWPWLAAVTLASALGAVAWLRFVPATPTVVAPEPSVPMPSKATVTAAAPLPSVAAPAPSVADLPAAPAPPSASTADDEAGPKPLKSRKKVAEKKPQPAPEEPKHASPIASLQELPDSIRQQIPPLAVGGYIYSGNKADRSVLINNRLLREGDEAAPGVTLEAMTPSGMVLSYQGHRFRIKY